MNTLLQEAALDRRFNTTIGSIQRAIETLNGLAKDFQEQNARPESSQLMALWDLHEDIQKLYGTFELLKRK